MIKARTEFLNVDIDLKSATDPDPFVRTLGAKVLSQRLGKTRRGYWVRFTLGRQPNKPADVILRFAQLVAKSSPKNRAIWAKAISKEFDIGIQGGFEPTSAEWVLEPNVVNTAARLGAGLRITVYSPDLLQEGSKGRPSITGDNKRLKRTVEKRRRSAAGR